MWFIENLYKLRHMVWSWVSAKRDNNEKKRNETKRERNQMKRNENVHVAKRKRNEICFPFFS